MKSTAVRSSFSPLPIRTKKSKTVTKMSMGTENVHGETSKENVQENVTETGKMIPSSDKNVTKIGKMSPSSNDNVTICEDTPQTNVPELTDEELALPLEPFERKNVKDWVKGAEVLEYKRENVPMI